MTTDERALTGTVDITYDKLIRNIEKIELLLTNLSDARAKLQEITTRPLRQAWSPLPSLVSFAGPYVDACSTTIAIIDQAEIKVTGMADALRVFATQMQLQDQAALDALAALQVKVDDALAPPPPPVLPSTAGERGQPI